MQKRRGGCRRRIQITAAVVAGVLVVAVVAGLWRLNRGPVSLEFLEPRLSWQLSSGPDSLTLKISDPALTWGGWRRPVDLRAGPVVITDPQNRIVVEVNEVSVGLAWLDLLKKKVALTRIEVRSTHLRLLRTEDGRFIAGFEARDKATKKPPSRSNDSFQKFLKETLTSPVPIPPFDRLTSISITDSRATIDDRKLDRIWGVPKLDLELRRKRSDLHISIDGIVDLEVQQTEMRVRGVFKRIEQRLRWTLSLTALRPSSIARFVPAAEMLSTVDMPIDIRLETDVSTGGTIHSANVDVRSKMGRIESAIRPTDDDGLSADGTLTDIRLSELAGLLPELASITHPINGTFTATLSSEHDFERGGIRLQSDLGRIESAVAINPDDSATVKLTLAEVQSWKLAELFPDLDRIRVPISAKVEAKLTAEHSLESLQLSLTGGAGTISVPEIHAQPFELESLALEATTEALTTFRISNLEIDLPGLSMQARASADRGETTTGITADASLSTFETSRIDQYWPSTLVPDVLEWISTNITAGSVQGAKVHTELSLASDFSGPVSLTDLRGSFAFDDLTVAYLAPMPAATGVTGTATFTDRDFEFDVTTGAVQDIVVESAEVGIAPLSGSTRLSVDAHDITGPVTTAISAIAGPPLELIGEGLPQPTDFSGSAVTQLVLNVPLSGSDPVPITVSGTSQLTGVGLEGWLVGYALSRGDLELQFDMENLDVQGTAQVNNVPATFRWHEDLTGGATPRTITATATLDDTGRQAIGIPPLPQVRGPIELSAELTGRADGSMVVALESDLSHAALGITQLGWSKPTETPGLVTARVDIGPDLSVTVDPYHVVAGDLRADGTVRVAPGFASLRELQIADLRYADNQISAGLSIGSTGDWEVTIVGSRFDIGPLVSPSDEGDSNEQPDHDDQPSNGPGFPPFEANVSLVELVSGANSLGGFAGSGRFDGLVWTYLHADLEVAPENVLKIRTKETETKEHELRVTAVDAGEVLSVLLPRSELTGGALEITAHRINRESPIHGTFRLEDYVITDSTSLTRLLQVASIGGALDAMAGEGISFKTLQSDFSLKRPILKVKNFRTTGSSLGITSDGTLDFSTGLMDFKGAVVPASRIQRALGKIPGLGIILTGVKGEGMFAVNYHIHGPHTKPAIDVNPLSGLTPGILRDMFRIPDAADDTDKENPD